MWIEQFVTVTPSEGGVADAGQAPAQTPTMNGGFTDPVAERAFRERYGLIPRSAETPSGAPPGTDAGAGARKKGGTNDINTIKVTFRAISLKNVDASANKDVVYSVLNEIRNSPFFDSDAAATHDDGPLSEDEAPGTFTFPVVIGLKHPLKL